MTRQIFSGTVVNDVCAMLEGSLQRGAHHGVVYDDDRVGTAFLDGFCDGGQINNFEEGVSRGLEKNHGNVFLWMEEGGEGGRISRIEVVYGDALVGLEVREETICATIEVIAGDDGICRLEDAKDGVEGGHARGYGKGMGCGGYLCDVVLCGRMSRR